MARASAYICCWVSSDSFPGFLSFSEAPRPTGISLGFQPQRHSLNFIWNVRSAHQVPTSNPSVPRGQLVGDVEERGCCEVWFLCGWGKRWVLIIIFIEHLFVLYVSRRLVILNVVNEQLEAQWWIASQVETRILWGHVRDESHLQLLGRVCSPLQYKTVPMETSYSA